MTLHTISIDRQASGKRFDGIGVVNGGGATSVLLKDYPQPQRDQILDLVYKPKFGASVSALLVEIPGDGNSTQGSMPSHMHTRDDLNYQRGYIWWILSQAMGRNPRLSIDGTAWSAPGWLGNGEFWSQDTADYYVAWLEGLRHAHGLEFDAIGCRNEKGYSVEFAKMLRTSLDTGGFENVRLHAFDHFTEDKFDFVQQMVDDPSVRDAIDILGAHILYSRLAASPQVQAQAQAMGKPIWNTEEHVYLKGFECAITIVQSFNDNYIRSGATRVVNWYDIAGIYPMQPYPEDPSMLLAHWPWCGHYKVREALWGYAHYGQFTEVGWHYVDRGCGKLDGGGSYVTLKSSESDFSVIVETRDATLAQSLSIEIGRGLSHGPLSLWRSIPGEMFARQPAPSVIDGRVTLTLDPNAIYSLTTTTGQRKGSFDDIPEPRRFDFPYRETFDRYAQPARFGYLPRYFADISGAFELVDSPDQHGRCLRQVVPVRTISWAPDWMPYTILGDEHWDDYQISAQVRLNEGDVAGVMGRVNHVGTGYGFIPKGYVLELDATGLCRLSVVRGKKDKKAMVGDNEQQAMIAAGGDDGAGGEKVLAEVRVPDVHVHRWHKLALRCQGHWLTALVDDQPVMRVQDTLYAKGMAGLLAGANTGGENRLSTPWFKDVIVKAPQADDPPASRVEPEQMPIYSEALPTRLFRNLRDGKRQTVVVYGTSLTHTAEWPKAMQQWFADQFGGLVTFVNAAMSGQHARWGLAELPARVLPYKPDLIVIEFSINDAATKHAITVRQSVEYLDAMVQGLREQNAGIEIILQTMNSVWDQPNEPDGKKGLSSRPNLAAYYQAYRDYADAHRLALIDHHARWTQMEHDNRAQFERWIPDGTHPTPQASLAVTWPAIQSLLERASGA